jgi:uncharacterized membrane protein YgdD (TMEM256/DUF423 family)
MRVMWIRVAAVYGVVGVLLGAFGAHGLRDRIDASHLATWHTAVSYQLFHSVALLALGFFATATNRPLGPSPWLFAIGIACFSGSLYVLALAPVRWLGPLTPVGGLLLIAGWASLLLIPRA